jgi:hypothetical protein
MELPNPPLYRRWSFLLAAVIVLAAIAAMLGWRGLQDVATPSTTTTVPTTSIATTTTEPPTSSTSTSKPSDVLWEADEEDGGTVRSRGFEAPGGWRIEWAFACRNFSKLGGGNFKITGDGAFERASVQETDVEASGTRSFSRGGFGRLLVESVCERWSVKVYSG